MTSATDRLTAAERRAAIRGPLYRVLGTPVVALLGLVNTAIIVRQTGAEVFGLVALVGTVTLLFPFADLGIGATVITAAAQLRGDHRDVRAADVIRRAYRVLLLVAIGVTAVAFAIMALDGWTVLTGFSSGPADRWAVTAAAVVFAATIPAGLGVRILIGLDRAPLATVALMGNSVFALAITVVLYRAGAQGIWYCLSALGGLLAGQLVGTVFALRISGLGLSALGPVRGDATGLLRGSPWLFLMGVGVPVGLQAGRVLLAHLSTPMQLAQYALMAQIYAVCWSAFSMAGFAFWPVFVKRRSDVGATLRIWARMSLLFAGAATGVTAVLVVLAPWGGRLLSGGTISITAWLALSFGALLIAQCAYVTTSMLMTRPDEARVQAVWALCMGALSTGLGAWWAARFGAVGVAGAAALAVVVTQVLPALLWVPRMVRRRVPVAGDAAPPSG